MAKMLKKEDMQALVSQIQQQAGDGEIDASLIDQLAEAVNGTVDQAGDVNNDGAETANTASKQLGGGDVQKAPPPPATHAEPDGDEGDDDEINKAVKPVASRPPEILVRNGAVDGMENRLPDFIKALSVDGSLKKAQEVADIRNQGQGMFDEMLNKSARAVLNQAGFTYRNLGKLHNGAPADLDLAKSMDSSALPGVNLMPLARLMMPVYAGLTRRFPLNTPQGGSDRAKWRVRMGFSNVDWSALMVVGEAAIGQEVNEPFTEFESLYRDIAINDKVTLKAIAASRGYDDPLQVSVITAMTIALSGQEKKLLGDNFAALGKPASVTGVATGTGTIGTATDKFIVSALSYRGYLALSQGGAAAIGETDGTLSAAVDLSAAAGYKLDWPAVPGAVAYNVFYNPASHATNKFYVATVTVNHFESTATLPVAGNAPSATDKSANANGYEGLISWCERSTIYTKPITGKIAPVSLNGAKLTKGTGGIVEIDSVLAKMWTQWKIAPTLMVMSANMVGAVTDLLMGLNQYRIEVSAERGNIAGGMFVGSYTNRFAPYADGTPRTIEIMPHPEIPDGTILFLCETVPYQMSRETRGWAREQLIPYTYFPLAATSIEYPYALTLSEMLECFHPSVQTALVGIGL